MKTYTVKIESGVQIRIESVDENMKIYDGLISYLDNSKDVKCIKKAMTFETYQIMNIRIFRFLFCLMRCVMKHLYLLKNCMITV